MQKIRFYNIQSYLITHFFHKVVTASSSYMGSKKTLWSTKDRL